MLSCVDVYGLTCEHVRRFNWIALREDEGRLWSGDPENGIPPDPAGDCEKLLHA